MFIPCKDYLKRISTALEHVAAPLIEDDFARGQVLAAVFLIDNLSDRIDYKPDLIQKEADKCCETINEVFKAVSKVTDQAPAELSEFVKDLEEKGPQPGLIFRNLCDKMLSTAIDWFFTHRDKLESKVDLEIDAMIIKYLTDINMRDLGMLKVSTSGKLIQSKDKT